jgi:hypothetical protein
VEIKIVMEVEYISEEMKRDHGRAFNSWLKEFNIAYEYKEMQYIDRVLYLLFNELIYDEVYDYIEPELAVI